MNKIIICLLGLVALTTGQRITTIHLDGVQYFISRMNPYSPELNYFLAYQYCRSLGLQLASFETKEKAESMTTYLKNAGYGNYDFWTSGNRLGTGMFLWMSTGLPFNATFDFFENSADAIQAGLLDPIDHNSNTAPQRTARDSSSGAEKGCVILKQPTLKWMPEDCSAVKDFICEQTRCYYYNYGSIPVSSAQGRPIITTTTTTTTTTTPRYTADSKLKTDYPRILPSTSTTTTTIPTTTAALPLISMSTLATIHSRRNSNQPSYVSLKLDQERALNSIKSHSPYQRMGLKHHSNLESEVDSEAELEGEEAIGDGEGDSDAELLADADVDNDADTNAGDDVDDAADVEVAASAADDDDDAGHEAIGNKQHHNENDAILVKDLHDVEENSQSPGFIKQQASNTHDDSRDQNEPGKKTSDLDNDINAISSGKGKEKEKEKENSSELGNEKNSISINRKQFASSSKSGPTVTALPTDIHQQTQHKTDSTPTVEERLKQIAQEVEKRTQEKNRHIPSLASDIGLDDIGHQSFLSLSDLIRTLRPNDKQIIPQIDSDYSNAMRVLGEKSVVVNNEQQRQQYQ